MYAVVEIGGHQYRVSEGDVLFVDKQKEEAGNTLNFDKVLLIKDDNGGVTVGKPVIEGASITAELLDNVKADKVIVFKKKRRKGYQKKTGHRQPMSRIEIKEISASGAKKSAEKAEKKEQKKARKSEPKAEKKAETKEEAGGGEQQLGLSTDMNAKEAIKIIRNTPLDQLEGFVPEDEDRVTVQRAWDSKQEE